MKRGFVLGVGLSLASASLVTRPAHAFEREWHTGAGLGVSVYPHYYRVGPAFGLQAAYGISDVFDLKLELLGSQHSYFAGPKSPSQWAAPLSIAGGLSYKL